MKAVLTPIRISCTNAIVGLLRDGEKIGLNIRHTVNAKQHLENAIEMLDSEGDFDLILMDVMMPEMDGLEAMQCIRSNPKYKNLPIIALTAKAMKDDRARCIEAGANDYLSKPVDTNKLKAIVKMWLGQA